MDETPRFPSLFFRQRLNGIVLPMLGGIALFLLLPFAAALGIVGLLSAVCFVFLFRKKGEGGRILLCVLIGLSLSLLIIGIRGLDRAGTDRLCGKVREAEGFVVAKGEGNFQLSLYRLDGKPFYKRALVETEAPWRVGEKLRVPLVLISSDPIGCREDGIDVLADELSDGEVIGKSLLYSVVGSVRGYLFSEFSSYRNGAFLSAVLLGERSGLTESQTQAFRRTASSHILAISGLHISQTVAFLVCLLRFFPISNKVNRFLLYPFIIVLYLLAGAGVSVFRASVMTLFSITGILLRHRSDSLTALCFSAGLLVIANPYALESFSFLLSYASTFGLVTCAVPLSEYMHFRFREKDMHPILKLLQGLLLSFAMASISFVFTLPVQLLLFDTVSPFAPLYSVLLIPLFQLCLILTLLASVLMGIPMVPQWAESFLLKFPSAFPELVEFLAKGAPPLLEGRGAGMVIALFFLLSLVIMFWRKAPLTGIFLLHGISIVFFGLFSLLQKFLL
ncbi:MAG: ComEC/Rec2 family competence protein [Clostridia bacterium]|nr:ComEC/Rec2 family competence protein [Clostridia bacterium]